MPTSPLVTQTRPRVVAPTELPAFLQAGSLAKKAIGDVSEAAVSLALQRAGLNIAVPVGDRQRHDLAIQLGHFHLTVQVKTGRYFNNGTIACHVRSVAMDPTTNRWVSRTYRDDVDLIAVYCPELHKAYLIPTEEVGVTVRLRVHAARNGQTKHIRTAYDYDIEGPRLPFIVAGALQRWCERTGCPYPTTQLLPMHAGTPLLSPAPTA